MEKNKHFSYTIVTKCFENDKIQEGNSLKTINGGLDPYDYHLKQCGKDAFKTLEHSHIHTFWPDDEEGDEDDGLVEEDGEDEDLIEAQHCNGNNEVVRVFSQKFVLMI